MYSILQKSECLIVLVSRNSFDYATYILSGYGEVYFGTKKDCEKYKESIECDLNSIEL